MKKPVRYTYSKKEIKGFEYGGYPAPGHVYGDDPNDDALDVAKWDWINEQCPNGCGHEFMLERRRWKHYNDRPYCFHESCAWDGETWDCLKDASESKGITCYNVGEDYIWFDDEITATLYVLRFGKGYR